MGFLGRSSGQEVENRHSHRHPVGYLLKDHLARPLNGPDTQPVQQREDGLYLAPATNLTLNDGPLAAETRLQLGDVIGTPDGSFTAIRLEP